jgi:hypothetical protein
MYSNLCGVENRYYPTFGKKNMEGIIGNSNSFGGFEKHVGRVSLENTVLNQRNENISYLSNKQSK